jgi:hypothetical protein
MWPDNRGEPGNGVPSDIRPLLRTLATALETLVWELEAARTPPAPLSPIAGNSPDLITEIPQC